MAAATEASDPLFKLVNDIASRHVLKDLNAKLPARILELGLDPLVSIAVASMDSKVHDVRGLQSLVIDSVHVTAVTISNKETVASFTCKAHLQTNLLATLIMGDGSSLNVEIQGLRVRESSLQASLDLHQLQIKSLKVGQLDLAF
ncbi:unnamed protein product [Polarella glacialis]|uniref:Uncharacterized protein n=1 Tax=Polarella glacialis TaxID=89957 RepID=A0A813DN43_POLGL|nr:unnamed protein product [Polarella glacialis]CAE8709457.1 unnamed protein product [Polarella glacialis]